MSTYIAREEGSDVPYEITIRSVRRYRDRQYHTRLEVRLTEKPHDGCSYRVPRDKQSFIVKGGKLVQVD